MFTHAITRLPGPDFHQGLTTSALPAPDLDLQKCVANHELLDHGFLAERSEERRVGKECRSRWSPYH